MKKIIFSLLLIINYSLLIINSATAQPALSADRDTSRLRISLLTCTPGEELYSSFGHSAFRVIDSNSVTDIVYNYGTFNFDDDDFYLKFVRGKLLYYVSTEYFTDFKNLYESENRGITEQVLLLSASEKIAVKQFLNENIKAQNRFYKYDFFFDNCTTRLRDIINKQHDSIFCQKPVMPAGTTFRQAIHEYLDHNGQQWSELGIDVLMGRRCDATMTSSQMQFLPDNLMISLDSSDHPMVLTHQQLIKLAPQHKGSFISPLLVFSLLMLMIILLSRVNNKWVGIFLQGFDGILFFCTGILGIIIILMWTATDHIMCSDNLNLLWAWPTHIFAAFFVYSKKSWAKKYFGFTAIALTIFLLAWYFLPQQMNTALIPILLLMIYRSAGRYLTPVKPV